MMEVCHHISTDEFMVSNVAMLLELLEYLPCAFGQSQRCCGVDSGRWWTYRLHPEHVLLRCLDLGLLST